MENFDLIKDIDGKNYLSLESSSYDDPNRIGSKFDDFEILQQLGSGAFGTVFKVLSKINNKIYAMKKMNIREIREENEKAYQLTLNETAFLSELTNKSKQPHIIKYYKHFVEGDYLHIVIEFIENGDMDGFIEAHKKINQHIPEEELWSIFLQCMEGLTYIHEMGVIHRDIKPANLLMDNNMTIKLGDFGVSAVKVNLENSLYLNANYNFVKASEKMKYHGTVVGTQPYMAKELIEENEYDQKVDVYSMGVSFYEMCYYHLPKKVRRKRDSYGNYIYEFVKIEKPEDKNVHYSNELLNIINLMLEEDKDKRKSSKFFLEMIKTEFSKKYRSNSSIDAIMRCLYSFKDLTTYYLNLKANFEKMPITKAYINCLNSFTKQQLKCWFDSIKYFREILCTENTKFDKSKEIDPKLVLAFLIHQMHSEINDKISQNSLTNRHYINSGEEKAKSSQEEMLYIFGNKLLPKFNSYICRKLHGLTKTTNICSICNMRTFSFIGTLFISFDLEKIQKMFNGPLDIEKCFYIQNNYNNLIQKFCIKCLTQTNHSQFKTFYSAPDLLIILFQRGVDYSQKIPISIKDIIDLSNFIESGGKKYKLVGFINKNSDNGKYYSIINFNNNYFRCEDTVVKGINQLNIFNDQKGEVIMAFYEAINFNNY